MDTSFDDEIAVGCTLPDEIYHKLRPGPTEAQYACLEQLLHTLQRAF
jgi:hypothetical protein